jgi:hypothetical protein
MTDSRGSAARTRHLATKLLALFHLLFVSEPSSAGLLTDTLRRQFESMADAGGCTTGPYPTALLLRILNSSNTAVASRTRLVVPVA